VRKVLRRLGVGRDATALLESTHLRQEVAAAINRVRTLVVAAGELAWAVVANPAGSAQ
jgi:hypothetical protein